MSGNVKGCGGYSGGDGEQSAQHINKTVNIVVFGGSGDLAQKKIFPALFSLFCRNYLPQNINFFAFARTSLSQEAFRKKISSSLTCRYSPEQSHCKILVHEFLERCHYVSGQYDSGKSYDEIYAAIKAVSGGMPSENIFYFAVPSNVYMEIASGLICAENICEKELANSKLVLEKPFGRDRHSSDLLTEALTGVFDEKQIYRIDHYLGKEMVQNLLVLRFANLFLEPLWSKQYIEKVEIVWEENAGVFGRSKYFDDYGIIRDVIQNHLLQILALTAMEEPASLSAEDIRCRKVELLNSVKATLLDKTLTGQYGNAVYKGVMVSGYTDEQAIPDDSQTPTFARINFEIDNDRWHGVPFVISAGKGMNKSVTEVRVKLKAKGNSMFCSIGKCPEPNELVIRIQPNEGFHFKITTKSPGDKLNFAIKDLDLSYIRAFNNSVLPEAYETLLLDVICGNKELFISSDELQVSWDILMPVLRYLEEHKVKPETYPFGTVFPDSSK
ncbi:MAG: glucose-6-phosphate dehydrogenase [Victivallaceae bacterium]